MVSTNRVSCQDSFDTSLAWRGRSPTTYSGEGLGDNDPDEPRRSHSASDSWSIGSDDPQADLIVSLLQHFLRIQDLHRLDQPRDEAGPPGLMARADARAVVAVEVFVKKDQIAPV